MLYYTILYFTILYYTILYYTMLYTFYKHTIDMIYTYYVYIYIYIYTIHIFICITIRTVYIYIYSTYLYIWGIPDIPMIPGHLSGHAPEGLSPPLRAARSHETCGGALSVAGGRGRTLTRRVPRMVLMSSFSFPINLGR